MFIKVFNFDNKLIKVNICVVVFVLFIKDILIVFFILFEFIYLCNVDI